MKIEMHKASPEDAEIIASLFDSYCMFYSEPSDINGTLQFVKKAIGFIQLYPIFTWVGMQRAWMLNDLFIHRSARGKGVGTSLLNAAKDFGQTVKSKWMMLQTANDNYSTQACIKKWMEKRD